MSKNKLDPPPSTEIEIAAIQAIGETVKALVVNKTTGDWTATAKEATEALLNIYQKHGLIRKRTE